VQESRHFLARGCLPGRQALIESTAEMESVVNVGQVCSLERAVLAIVGEGDHPRFPVVLQSREQVRDQHVGRGRPTDGYDHIHAMCGPDFFDDLITHSEVAKAFDRYLDGAFLRQGQARGSFEYSVIVFEQYRGRVGTVDFTDASKAYFFPVGVPGLFRQYNAPADFVETANTIGPPRYAKQAVDQQFARWVMLHVQSNPLPICTRPRVLIKGKRT
jgi:Phage major capsid protein E